MLSELVDDLKREGTTLLLVNPNHMVVQVRNSIL
jgi:hypothetical protein